jgi:hypothetical protein
LVLVGRSGLVVTLERLVLHQCSVLFRLMVVAVAAVTRPQHQQRVVLLDQVVVQAKLQPRLHQVHRVRV